MNQNSSGKLFLGQFPRFFLKTAMMTQQRSVGNVKLNYVSWRCSKTVLFKAAWSDFKMCVDCLVILKYTCEPCKRHTAQRFNLHILLLIKLTERVVSCCSVSKHCIQLIQPINSHFSAFACILHLRCTDSPMLTFAYMTEIQKADMIMCAEAKALKKKKKLGYDYLMAQTCEKCFHLVKGVLRGSSAAQNR